MKSALIACFTVICVLYVVIREFNHLGDEYSAYMKPNSSLWGIVIFWIFAFCGLIFRLISYAVTGMIALKILRFFS